LIAGGKVGEGARRGVLARHWDWALQTHPLFATRLGDHRFDDRIADTSARAIAARRDALAGFLADAKGLTVGPEDRDTLALFIELVQTDLDVNVCHDETWDVSIHNMDNISEWNQLPTDHPLATAQNGSDLGKR